MQPNTQALPDFNHELSRPQTASAQAQGRIQELEQQVVIERARADAAGAELEALREYKAYWEPKIKEISDLYTRQGGELATATQLAHDLIASLHGDGNGRCWCGAREADQLRSYLERNNS